MSTKISYEDYQQLEIPLAYTKAPKPDRVHVGVVQLSTEHSLDFEWSKLLRDQALCFSSRVYYNGSMTVDDLAAISKGICDASDLIACGLTMDVMAFSCTSASIVIGEDKVAQLLRKNRGNIPATNPWTAAKAAFRALGAKKIAIFSPYPTPVNYSLYQQLMTEGFEISTIGSLGISKDTDITQVSKESMILALEKLLLKTDAEVLFMSCTNLRVMEHLQDFEERFNLPIVTSNSALFWHVMHLAGKNVQCPGYGQLLKGF